MSAARLRIDLDQIEAAARAAQEQAPGPYRVAWIPGDDARGIDGITDANGDDVVISDSGTYPPRAAVAEHIAGSSPDVVLELVKMVRELRAGLVEALDAWCGWVESDDDPGLRRIRELSNLPGAPPSVPADPHANQPEVRNAEVP